MLEEKKVKNKNINIKKATAATVSVCMALGMGFGVTGCDAFKDTSVEDVTALTEDFCNAAATMKVKDLVKCFEDGEDEKENIEALFAGTDAESTEVYKAIADTIVFDFDDGDIEASKKEGETEVDVTFELVDYQAVYDAQQYEDEDAFIAAIGAADETVTKDMTIEFEYAEIDDEKQWVVSNAMDILEDLYDFTDFVPEYKIPLQGMVSDITWSLTDDGTTNEYTNVTYITAYLTTYSEYSLETAPVIYYEVYYNDSLFYISENSYDAFVDGYIATYDADEGFLELNEDGFLQAGTYKIVFYDEDFVSFAESSCQVYCEEIVPDVPDTPDTPDGGDISSASDLPIDAIVAMMPLLRISYDNADAGFVEDGYISGAWQDDGNGGYSDAGYDSALSTSLVYTVETSADFDEPLEYVLVPALDGSLSLNDIGSPDADQLITGSLERSENDAGNAVYTATCECDMTPGAYILYIISASYADNGNNGIVVFDLVSVY